MEAYKEGGQRIVLLDALRAFALFGLLLVHCAVVFEMRYSVPQPEQSPVHDWVMFLFAGKSYALFAFCFGISKG
jgi:uncharacterized protein